VFAPVRPWQRFHVDSCRRAFFAAKQGGGPLVKRIADLEARVAALENKR